MPETPPALRALVGFLLRRGRDICWVVIKVLVPLQQLLLSKALVALVTLERFLVCVYQHVGLQVASVDGGVGAEVTLEAFFPLMGFLVNFQGVTIWEGFPTHLAFHRSLTGVQVPNMQSQICFPTTGDWAQLTLKRK